MKLIRGVILDIDGTLIDSNDAHAQAWVEALKAGGHDVEFAKIRRLIGEGSDKLLPDVVGLDAESPEGKKLSQASGDIFKSQYLPHIQPFPARARSWSGCASAVCKSPSRRRRAATRSIACWKWRAWPI